MFGSHAHRMPAAMPPTAVPAECAELIAVKLNPLVVRVTSGGQKAGPRGRG